MLGLGGEEQGAEHTGFCVGSARLLRWIASRAVQANKPVSLLLQLCVHHALYAVYHAEGMCSFGLV